MATARGAASSDTPTYPYFRTRVVRSAQLTPHLTRITVGAPELAGFPDRGPDQHLKLFFPRPGQGEPEIPPFEDDDVASWYRRYLAMPDDVRPDMRTYTARAFRPDAAELDIDFVLPGERAGAGGPAARWAERAAPGDPVGVLASTSEYHPPATAAWLLLVGDHSALPAIATILESVDPDLQVLAYLELEDPADELPLPIGPRSRLRWVPRTARDAAPGDAVANALRHADFPLGTPYAWLAGEAGLVRSVRRHLANGRAVPKRMITFAGYWRCGKAENDAYTEQELAELGVGQQS